MKLYFICPIHLHGMVLDEASTGITLHFTLYFQTTEINIYVSAGWWCSTEMNENIVSN
jgi:hypothetical protein